uniref:uncharacterized protein LOC108587708 n=1 Tax=Callithrix jacchus TaxID=9483 RepID=UPI00159F6F4D|nr:uncharacterized protein LOC108587708 [Callithrix jacchus]XP_035162764.1 uncharacterized protein LOC108587708 [Callithrix jacchus]XP_035162765.1 uncharacterized protein LOC108587708 [Callithrix jacchus]XP_054114459.1 uncharacterized protein LOC108587708 [Callithrix jacchus]XP_054114460.1 uncharacterized protein LOC108587708 [Callithrix jacchus]
MTKKGKRMATDCHPRGRGQGLTQPLTVRSFLSDPGNGSLKSLPPGPRPSPRAPPFALRDAPPPSLLANPAFSAVARLSPSVPSRAFTALPVSTARPWGRGPEQKTTPMGRALGRTDGRRRLSWRRKEASVAEGCDRRYLGKSRKQLRPAACSRSTSLPKERSSSMTSTSPRSACTASASRSPSSPRFLLHEPGPVQPVLR